MEKEKRNILCCGSGKVSLIPNDIEKIDFSINLSNDNLIKLSKELNFACDRLIVDEFLSNYITVESNYFENENLDDVFSIINNNIDKYTEIYQRNCFTFFKRKNSTKEIFKYVLYELKKDFEKFKHPYSKDGIQVFTTVKSYNKRSSNLKPSIIIENISLINKKEIYKCCLVFTKTSQIKKYIKTFGYDKIWKHTSELMMEQLDDFSDSVRAYVELTLSEYLNYITIFDQYSYKYFKYDEFNNYSEETNKIIKKIQSHLKKDTKVFEF